MKDIKKSVLNCINIFPNGKRTSVGLSPIQYNIARELADIHNMSLNKYLCMLVESGKKVDKRYGRCMAIRDGLLVELYRMLTKGVDINVKVNGRMN